MAKAGGKVAVHAQQSFTERAYCPSDTDELGFNLGSPA
jgi:hypothetical protein